MKNLTKKAILTTALTAGIATSAQAEVNAYYFDESTKGATLHSEFKKGDFNPYWFQEKEVSVYAYEANSKDIQFHREFKEGDFNPYWFQEDGEQMIAQDETNTKNTKVN